MRTISVRRCRGVIAAALAVTAAAGSASSTSAPADAAEAEAFCSRQNSVGQAMGAMHDGGNLRPAGTVETERTSWSDQLSAVVYRARLIEGFDAAMWRAQLEESLRGAGWGDRADRAYRRLAGSDSGSTLLVKTLGTGRARREMMIEIDTPGALYLRCGDLALLQLDAAERDGDLAQGSARPTPAKLPRAALPAPDDCARPQWRAAFADVSQLEQIGSALQLVLPDAEVFEAGGGQAERLRRWLHWKLKTDGGLSDAALAEIEDKAGQWTAADVAEMEQSLIAMAAVGDAQRAGDGLGTCRAIIALLLQEYSADHRRAERLGQINAALEAEGLRRGIALN